nr:hypothetical protein [Sphingosinithalassobacter tenebrarum]
MRWPQGAQQCDEFSFEIGAANGLAIVGASLLHAKVIGVMLGASLRPAAVKRLAAGPAHHEVPQREITVDVLLGRSLGGFLHPLLRPLPCRKADKRLVLAFEKRNVPLGDLDISGIDRALEQFADVAMGQPMRGPIRPFGLACKEAIDFCLGLEPPCCVAFKSLGNHGGERFVGHQHLAVARHLFVAIADRGLKTPIACQRAGTHAVLYLFGILLAVVLGDAGEKVFDELAVAVRAELDRGGGEDAARFRDFCAELKMRRHIAGESADIVDDYGMRFGAMLA